MSYSDFMKDRIAFVEIDRNTIAALAEFKPEIEKALPGILKQFYDHIKKWPNLASMFKDQSRMDYARLAQQSHWMHLFDAKFDENYIQSVRKIGLVHSRIGLEPTWYIGAYAFTLNHLYAHASGHYQSLFSPAKAREKTACLLRAINQCVMIDMDVAITVYLDENKNTYNKKLNVLGESFESNIGNIIQGVSASSTELENNAGALTQVAAQTSTSASSVALSAEQAAGNVASVSSATEEMSASISNVERLAQSSFEASNEAVEETRQSMEMMADLNAAIHKIEEITALITTIAGQTNLLALNATIEAARAGEAGKGFSVVATEVKNLATETAKATEDIRKQVADILVKSDATAQSIEKVRNVIQNVNAVSRDTAESVSQQRQAVDEIARNVDQASYGTTEITRSIKGISEAALQTGQSADQVLAAVRNLLQQNKTLNESVSGFMDELKSGS